MIEEIVEHNLSSNSPRFGAQQSMNLVKQLDVIPEDDNVDLEP
jgi:hypothetical protein